MLATGCQNLGRLNRKLSEVLTFYYSWKIEKNIAIWVVSKKYPITFHYAVIPFPGISWISLGNLYVCDCPVSLTLNYLLGSIMILAENIKLKWIIIS